MQRWVVGVQWSMTASLIVALSQACGSSFESEQAGTGGSAGMGAGGGAGSGGNGVSCDDVPCPALGCPVGFQAVIPEGECCPVGCVDPGLCLGQPTDCTLYDETTCPFGTRVDSFAPGCCACVPDACASEVCPGACPPGQSLVPPIEGECCGRCEDETAPVCPDGLASCDTVSCRSPYFAQREVTAGCCDCETTACGSAWQTLLDFIKGKVSDDTKACNDDGDCRAVQPLPACLNDCFTVALNEDGAAALDEALQGYEGPAVCELCDGSNQGSPVCALPMVTCRKGPADPAGSGKCEIDNGALGSPSG